MMSSDLINQTSVLNFIESNEAALKRFGYIPFVDSDQIKTLCAHAYIINDQLDYLYRSINAPTFGSRGVDVIINRQIKLQNQLLKLNEAIQRQKSLERKARQVKVVN